jgi:hypothetical protein
LPFHFFVFDFFNNLEVFSRPLYHAKKEFNGPGPASSRFGQNSCFAKNHEFGPKPVLYHFFVFDFFKRPAMFSRPFYHAEEEFDGQHLAEIIFLSKKS